MMDLESVSKQVHMGLKGDHPADEFDPHFKIFHALMRKKAAEILLHSTPCGACIMEEKGRPAERVIHEYQAWSLDEPQRLAWGLVRSEGLSDHRTCLDAAAPYGSPGNYVKGVNSAGFTKVVDGMTDQGLV
jgi:hypothetical protein